MINLCPVFRNLDQRLDFQIPKFDVPSSGKKCINLIIQFFKIRTHISTLTLLNCKCIKLHRISEASRANYKCRGKCYCTHIHEAFQKNRIRL